MAHSCAVQQNNDAGEQTLECSRELAEVPLNDAKRRTACDECIRANHRITLATSVCAHCKRHGCATHIKRWNTTKFRTSRPRLGLCQKGYHSGQGLHGCCLKIRGSPQGPPKFRWGADLAQESHPGFSIGQLESAASEAVTKPKPNNICRICEDSGNNLDQNGQVMCIYCLDSVCHLHSHIIHAVPSCNGWKFGFCRHNPRPKGPWPFEACRPLDS